MCRVAKSVNKVLDKQDSMRVLHFSFTILTIISIELSYSEEIEVE